MTFEAATLVRQTANNPGTGTFNLIAPATDRQSFVDGIGNGNTCVYVAIGAEGAEWGIGTVASGTPDTLARTSVIWTTDGSTAKLNFTGTVTIYNANIPELGVVLDGGGDAGPLKITYNAAADRATFNLLRATTGILFGTDTADANKLDDYEEVISSSMKVADASSAGNESGTTVTLRATKIGRILLGSIAFSNVDTTGLTGGNDLFLTGFPFTPTGATWLGIVSANNLAFTGTLQLFFNSGQTYLNIAETINGATRDFTTIGDLTDDVTDMNLIFICEVA